MAGRLILGTLAVFASLSDRAGAESPRRLFYPRAGSRRLASASRCSGTFECSGFFDGNQSVSKCLYGHKEENGNCDTPCTGVRYAMCTCMDEDAVIEAAREIALQAIGISAAFALICGVLRYRSGKKRSAARQMGNEPAESEQASAMGLPCVPGADVIGGNNEFERVADPCFTDENFDEVKFRLEGTDVNMYVNGIVEIRGLTGPSDIAIDTMSRTYRVQAKTGIFRQQEDLSELQKQVDRLFSAHAAALTAPHAGQGNVARSASRIEVFTATSAQIAQQNPKKVSSVLLLIPVMSAAALVWGLYYIVSRGAFYEEYLPFMGFCAIISVLVIMVCNCLSFSVQMSLLFPFVGLLGVAWGAYRLASPGSMYHDDCAGLTR
mmetsp:Transcript_56373/g.146538  ORF Transcript_56373/g.146538 Transcript_56373/m.146538 type:complete len:379 (+) Transcript_56373:64-1200(+)